MPKFVVDYSKDVPRPEGIAPTDARLFSASAERNAEPIHDVAVPRLSMAAATGAPPLLFEIGSGTGQHMIHLARSLEDWTLQPSDPNPAHLASIAAWIAHEKARNIAPPLQLDIRARRFPAELLGGILAINVLHITPIEVTHAILDCAASGLAPTGVLILYGPFARADAPLEPSNAAFDADLRAENPEWGLRNTRDIVEEARRRGLRLSGEIAMPANNLILFIEKASP